MEFWFQPRACPSCDLPHICHLSDVVSYQKESVIGLTNERTRVFLATLNRWFGSIKMFQTPDD